MKAKKTITEKYFEAVGRRKTAVARARLFTNTSEVLVNGKDFKEHFKTPSQQLAVLEPFEIAQVKEKLGATIKVGGGGAEAQSEAVRHGLARALVKYDAELRGRLKRAGFLTRDPRMVERKKYGLKKARRAPQWKKR